MFRVVLFATEYVRVLLQYFKLLRFTLRFGAFFMLILPILWKVQTCVKFNIVIALPLIEVPCISYSKQSGPVYIEIYIRKSKRTRMYTKPLDFLLGQS